MRAVIALLDLAAVDADDPMRRFNILIKAASVGRCAAHAAPAWAERYRLIAKTRTYAPTPEQIESATSDAFTLRMRDTIADLTTALLGGPSPLGIFLAEHGATAERVDDDWMTSESLRVVLSLAGFVVDRELMVAALTESVERRTPRPVPTPLAASILGIAKSEENIVRVHFASGAGYCLGSSGELAAVFRNRVGPIHPLPALQAFAKIQVTTRVRPVGTSAAAQRRVSTGSASTPGRICSARKGMACSRSASGARRRGRRRTWSGLASRSLHRSQRADSRSNGTAPRHSGRLSTCYRGPRSGQKRAPDLPSLARIELYLDGIAVRSHDDAVPELGVRHSRRRSRCRRAVRDQLGVKRRVEIRIGEQMRLRVAPGAQQSVTLR